MTNLNEKNHIGVVFSKGECIKYQTKSNDLKSVFNQIKYNVLDGYTPAGHLVSQVYIYFVGR